MKFTIDRSKWRCGHKGPHKRGMGDTSLYNHEGFMCCLGQVGQQCGLGTDVLSFGGTPDDIDDDEANDQFRDVLLTVGRYGDGSPCWTDNLLSDEAIAINDSEALADSEREAKLTALFASHGHEIEFTGEYVIPA